MKWVIVVALVLMVGCARVEREVGAGCECHAGEQGTRCDVGGKGNETELKP